MKILITGGSSLLGKYLIQSQPEQHKVESTWYTNHVGLSMHQMDVTNKSQVNYVFDRARPDVVIHCAANGSVDYAEQNYQEVHQVNVEGVKNIILAAKDHLAKVVYVSSNAVYSGENPPYSEKSACNPVNAYGKIKRQAEREVMSLAKSWLIIRPFMLYGWPFNNGRKNWGEEIYSRLFRLQYTKLVNDTIWQPTYALDCAEAIWRLLENDKEIYNVASSERATLYTFGLKVAKVFDFALDLIEPVSSDFFPSIAPRPKNTSYDLTKIKSLGIELSDIEEGLIKMKREVE